MSRYLLADTDIYNDTWYRFMIPFDTFVETTKKRQWRSRGKHDPGSGPYINRIVIGGYGDGTCQGLSGTVITGGLVTADTLQPGVENGWWARSMKFRYYAYGYIRKDPPGSHPTQPKYEHWYVRFWRIDYDRVRIYGSNNDRADYYYSPSYTYDCYSYYGAFPDDIRAAKDFLLKQVSGPSAEYPMRPCTSRSTNVYLWDCNFLMHEPKFSSEMDTLSSIDSESPLWPPGIQAGLANAYLSACDGLPRLHGMNNIANIIQTATLLHDFLHGKLNELGKLKDIWLGWRYEFSTTKMDIEEAAGLADRLLEVTKFLGSKYIRSNGQFSLDDYYFRASIGVQFDVISDLQSLAEKMGVELSGYNAWDLVPYSFVADWFLHVGDILERWELEKYSLKIPVDTCWLSIQRNWINEYGCHEIFYRRLSGRPNIRVADLDYISRSPSAVTVVKRATDVICLLS